MPLDRQDIVLLLAEGAEGGRHPFDPIRVMKGSFTVAMLGTPEMKAQFDFRPYDYGPFDASVYRARDALLGRGLLSSDRTGRYSSYSLTERGREHAATLRAELPDGQAEWLRQIGRWVSSKSFNDLLEEIYARFPEYAVRSKLRSA